MANAIMNAGRIAGLSLKDQTLATIGAVAAAVAMPQLLHALGAATGLGTALGAAFLPMHLPIILVGLLAGPFAGAIAGVLGPLVSFALSGMPGAAALPFMMAELCAYGLVAGMLRVSAMPALGKVLIAQVAGRALRAAAILLAAFAFDQEWPGLSSIWSALLTGLPGLALQWVLLPLIAFRFDGRRCNG